MSGAEITETVKYHIEIAECVTRLSVAETTADDANVMYTCQLISAAGQASSNARFVIQGMQFFPFVPVPQKWKLDNRNTIDNVTSFFEAYII